MTTVVHLTTLLDEPRLGATALALLEAGEQLELLKSAGGFLQVRRADGQAGFVPAALCAPLAFAAAFGDSKTVYMAQPVAFYRAPAPGEQFASDPVGSAYQWMIMTDEPLLVLGLDGGFALVQRADGRLGFVPKLVSTSQPSTQMTRTDRWLAAAGWGALGCGWALLNWVGVAAVLLELPLVELRPYLGIGLVFSTAAALWFGRRRLTGRSFAAGVLMCYAAMTLLSQGWLTLWRT